MYMNYTTTVGKEEIKFVLKNAFETFVCGPTGNKHNTNHTSLKQGQFVDSLTLVYFFWSPTCTHTTGSMLSPASWRASMMVTHTWCEVTQVNVVNW